VPQGPEFEIATAGVDPEISEIAGPQLVVPVINERYALNAANARWGSLYDALYGTDALGSPPPPGSYDPGRGNEVVAWVRQFLDEVVPLERGSHAESIRYSIADGSLIADLPSGPVRLADRSALAGYLGDAGAPTSVVLTHNGLHIELVIDIGHPVGKEDMAGVADVMIESAVTAIMDCEDSVAAVDTADKVSVYRNWLSLMKGDLSSEVPKDGMVITRRLAPDRMITAPDGTSTQLPARALMMVRNI
jgi:malate synthase